VRRVDRAAQAVHVVDVVIGEIGDGEDHRRGDAGFERFERGAGCFHGKEQQAPLHKRKVATAASCTHARLLETKRRRKEKGTGLPRQLPCDLFDASFPSCTWERLYLSFPNSIWERTCGRGLASRRRAGKEAKLPGQARSQVQLGNEGKTARKNPQDGKVETYPRADRAGCFDTAASS